RRWGQEPKREQSLLATSCLQHHRLRLARKTLNPSGAGLPFSFRAIKEVEIDGCEAAHPLCNWLGERFHPQVSATRVRTPKLATEVRHAAARATAILIPPASIAIVFRPAPVGSRSRTIAAYRPGRSRSYRILDNRNRSKPS